MSNNTINILMQPANFLILKLLLIVSCYLFVSTWSCIARAEVDKHNNTVLLKTLPDPTKPLKKIHKANTRKYSTLVLNSILSGTQRKVAIINGQRMRENEVFNGIRINKILPSKVIVTQHGKIIELKLRQRSVKNTNEKASSIKKIRKQ